MKFKQGESYLWLFPWVLAAIGIAVIAIRVISGRSDLGALAFPGLIVGITIFEIWSGVALDSWWRASHPRGTASYYGLIAWQLFVAAAFTFAFLTIK